MTLARQKCDTVLQRHRPGSIPRVSPFVFVQGLNVEQRCCYSPRGLCRAPPTRKPTATTLFAAGSSMPQKAHIVKVKNNSLSLVLAQSLPGVSSVQSWPVCPVMNACMQWDWKLWSLSLQKRMWYSIRLQRATPWRHCSHVTLVVSCCLQSAM